MLQAIVIPATGGLERVVANIPGPARPRKYLTWAVELDAVVASNRVKTAFALRLYRFPISVGPAQAVTEGPDASRDAPPLFLRMAAGSLFFDGKMAPRTLSGPFGSLAEVETPRHSAVPITSFSWKADNRTIVYGGGPMSTGELHQVTVDGHDTLAPFVLEGSSDQIAIAPNGSRLVYVLQNLDANIWRLPLYRSGDKKSDAPEKLFTSVREEMDPAYSPDGKSIAFVSNVPDIGTCGWETRMAAACASSRLKRSCRFIPHGLRIVARLPSIPRHRARARYGSLPPPVGAPGGWRQCLAEPRSHPGPLMASGCCFTPMPTAPGRSGKSRRPVELRFSSRAEELTTPRSLRMGAIFITAVCRGRSLANAFAPRLPDGSLANQGRELIRETLPVTGHRFWTLARGGIYFVDAQNEPAVLKFIDAASRKLLVLATLAKPPAKFTRGLSISPDGRYALYCQDNVDGTKSG